jgi:hypothetical protein
MSFDKKLNEWIEEDVPVRRLVPKESKGGVRFDLVTQMEKQRAIYVDAPPVRVGCKKGEHEWYMANKHTYFCKCRKCSMGRSIFPVTHTIKDGHIIHLVSGEIE